METRDETAYDPFNISDGPLIRSGEKIVLVLGAGASISEMAASDTDRPYPPTDANFLEIAKRCTPIHYEEVKQLFEHVWHGTPPYPLKYQRMEQVFSSVYLRVLQTSGRSAEGRLARNLYNALVELLRETLSHTTGKAIPTQHYDLLSRIRQANPSSFNILSFNYDVLADRALRKSSRDGLWNWNYTDGYGFKPTNLPIPRKKSEINLLKLHGSMNWYISGYVYRKDMLVYVPRPGGSSTSPPWQRRQHTLGHRKTKINPLMVPPVFEKGSQINGMLQAIWEKAATLLDEATLLLIWGYSLPETDYHAEVLFAQSARRAGYRLVVINLDKLALGRVTSVCGHTWNRWFFRAEHLLKTTQST